MRQRLPEAPFLSRAQQLMIFKAAHRLGRPEDREDFVQAIYAHAWDEWRAGDFARFGDDERPNVSRIDLLLSIGYRAVFGRRRTEVLPDDCADVFDAAPDQTFGDILDSVTPANQKLIARDRLWRFRLGDGSALRLSYAELEELTGMCRNSIWRTRRLDRPIDLYHFGDRLYGRLVDVQKEHGMTQAAARWRAKRVRLVWDEPRHAS